MAAISAVDTACLARCRARTIINSGNASVFRSTVYSRPSGPVPNSARWLAWQICHPPPISSSSAHTNATPDRGNTQSSYPTH